MTQDTCEEALDEFFAAPLEKQREMLRELLLQGHRLAQLVIQLHDETDREWSHGSDRDHPVGG